MGLVTFERWVEGIYKLANDGDRPSWAWEASLFGTVDCLLEDEESKYDSERGDDKRWFISEENVAQILGG